jgi:zinc transporter 1
MIVLLIECCWCQVTGVISVHDLHVWQLDDAVFITSVHLVCPEGCDDEQVLKDVREIFHKHKLHSSAIQIEHISHNNSAKVDIILYM